MPNTDESIVADLLDENPKLAFENVVIARLLDENKGLRKEILSLKREMAAAQFREGEFRAKIAGCDPITAEEIHAYKLFRFEVLLRDGNACQDCGSKTEMLFVHHILMRKYHPDKLMDMDNVVSLCNDCHLARHRKYNHRRIDFDPNTRII